MSSLAPCYVGADPGLDGAIAVYTPSRGDLVVVDMPTLDLKGKRRVDLHRLTALVSDFHNLHGIDLALVEEVHAMPKQGVVSTFNFGFSAAALQVSFVAAQVPMRLVPAASWKRLMGVTADKDSSRLMASRLLPQHAHQWTRKKDDGRAEAALLALYASRAGAALAKTEGK